MYIYRLDDGLCSISFISVSMSILGTEIHIEHIDGYTVLAHNPKLDVMCEKIKEAIEKKKKLVGVHLSPFEISHTKEAKFKKQCAKYFERNFKVLAKDNPLIIPWKLPEDHMGIEGIMDHWCKETNRSSAIKGLVLQSISLSKCLNLYGFTDETLRDYLHSENFSEAPIIVVYNPHEKVILLIRKAKSKKLAINMALSLNDVKMFILLFTDELKESGMKIIPLVVTDANSKSDNPELDCQLCLNHCLSEEEFKTFKSRWKDKSYFQSKSVGNLNKGFGEEFLAKATSLMAAAFIYPNSIPKFTSKPCEEMESLAVLLTRQQMEIFYSQDKHIIIKGGFGCGKTIVAAAILEKISEGLLEHEKLFYICYDSRSALVNHMIKDKQGGDVAKVIPVLNENGLNLSQIISDILQEEKNTENVNFVIDEYDSEDLNESEAKMLNHIFAQSLKEAFVFLIIQPIEKERTLNDTQIKGNMFHLLETMKTHNLTLAMRNSTEIHDLVLATKKILSKEVTVYIHYKDNEVGLEEKNNPAKATENATKENQKLSRNSPNESTSMQKDRPAYLEKTPKLGVDEAHAIAGVTMEMSNHKTISRFTYATGDKIGHKISFKKPKLFKLYGSKFEKVLSLIAVFEKLDIRNKEQVVLHLGTVNKEIPSTFQFIFEQHFGMHENLTNNYQEFTASKKSILISSFLAFRGLEHPKVTVVVDRDIYFIQHYLVEILARCTLKLSIVVLQDSTTLTKVTQEWETNQLVNQWKTICNKGTQKRDFTVKTQKDDMIINVTFKEEYYELLKNRFEALSNRKNEAKEFSMKSFAKKIIKQKR